MKARNGSSLHLFWGFHHSRWIYLLPNAVRTPSSFCYNFEWLDFASTLYCCLHELPLYCSLIILIYCVKFNFHCGFTETQQIYWSSSCTTVFKFGITTNSGPNSITFGQNVIQGLDNDACHSSTLSCCLDRKCANSVVFHRTSVYLCFLLRTLRRIISHFVVSEKILQVEIQVLWSVKFDSNSIDCTSYCLAWFTLVIRIGDFVRLMNVDDYEQTNVWQKY